ncbi:MAG: EAL domain-containing protein [Geobacteraceae bacterium]|nr:EAL domain-containing protein [Geobacteraceae bacterium]
MSEIQGKIFLGRQPILDRQKKIFGYELLFRAADTLHAHITDLAFAERSVISNVLSTFGVSSVLGKHKGFINVTGDLLMNDMLEILPSDRIVIELLETITATEPVLRRCRELKDRGFLLALDDNLYHPDYEPLYDVVDIVKIDILQASPETVLEMVKILRTRNVVLLAEKVETTQQYLDCLSLGFQLFQGYFFARPAVLNTKRVDVAGTTLLKLLQLVCSDAEFEEIEGTFKHNPTLTYNLLRLVNSVVIGMKEKIRTLRHALVVLGMQQLKRWVQLALFATESAGGVGNPLLETAAIRGRLMELLSAHQREEHTGKDYSESAFMTGVLSLIDVLFESPMEDILEQLNLTDDVRCALIHREGHLGRLLRVAESLESLDLSNLQKLLDESSCNLESLLEYQVQAIEWANRMEEGL